MGTTLQMLESRERSSPRAVVWATLDLRLKVSDPEVISGSEKHSEGGDHEDYALAALRVGSLALAGSRRTGCRCGPGRGPEDTPRSRIPVPRTRRQDRGRPYRCPASVLRSRLRRAASQT